MNMFKGLHLGFLLAAVIGFAGCATVSTTAIPPAPAPAATPGTMVDYPIEKVQKAALNALTVIGCDIVQQSPVYVQGHRPNKIGLLVGSGGEDVRVWLSAVDAQKTSMKVKTAKSFAGIAGQKNWDKAVVDEIMAELSK